MQLSEYARSNHRPELLAQWHPSLNGALTPEQVTPGSERTVWWRCEQGHEWSSRVGTRTRQGEGCPYCARQRVLPGQTDLASRYPAIASQWDCERNGGLSAAQVMPGSHRRFWWRCTRGHSWQSPPYVLIQGHGCPYCAGKRPIVGETDLATCEPALALEWDQERNGALTPQQVMSGSMKSVWWRCSLGHSYQARIFSRAAGTGCPYCAGKKVWPGFNDLATLFPALGREWHSELNGELTPQMVTRGSHKQVWWQCREGHTWKAAVFARTGGTGCPVCAGMVKGSRKPVRTKV